MLVQALGGCALIAWLAILLRPARPHLTRERIEPAGLGRQSDLRRVAVVIPARNEAAVIAGTIRALKTQGENLAVVVVDDQSDDGTAGEARRAARDAAIDLELIEGEPLPAGWGGKLWALEQGTGSVSREYCLLLDAEIELAPGTIRALFEKAVNENLAIVSVMARLSSASPWERLLAPPFVFFFKLIYPFARVNDPRARTAAAAGGCLLIEARVLRAIGGFEAIRGELIDDVSLAKRVKRDGHSIWLGLSDSVISHRRYPDLESFRRMVTRTAFTQLNYSAAWLGAVTLAMLIVFVAPLACLALPTGFAGRLLGAGAMAAMLAAYWPTATFYRLSPLWLATLPLAALLYLAMTVESALNYWRGVRAQWKGRTYGRA